MCPSHALLASPGSAFCTHVCLVLYGKWLPCVTRLGVTQRCWESRATPPSISTSSLRGLEGLMKDPAWMSLINNACLVPLHRNNAVTWSSFTGGESVTSVTGMTAGSGINKEMNDERPVKNGPGEHSVRKVPDWLCSYHWNGIASSLSHFSLFSFVWSDTEAPSDWWLPWTVSLYN